MQTYYPEGGAVAVMPHVFNRSLRAIQARAFANGLTKPGYQNPEYQAWSVDDVAILVAGCTESLLFLCEKLPARSKHAIRAKALALGFQLPARPVPPPKAPLEKVSRLKAGRSSALLVMWRQYRHGAHKRNKLFELDLEAFDALVSQRCHYCGLPPSRSLFGYPGFLFSGIDRKDNRMGYVACNVVSCCKDCNIAKGRSPYEAFLTWAARVASHRLSSLSSEI